MKRFKFLFFAITALLVNCLVNSCSDDKKDADSPNPPSVKMVLTEMRGNYIGESHTDEIRMQAKYDSSGQIIEEIYNEGYHNNFVYTDTKVIVNGNQSYEISNGKIVKDPDGNEFFYNSENQLIKSDFTHYTTSFIWKDGNIISASENEDGEVSTTTLTYYNLPNVGNINSILNVAYSTVFPIEGNDEFALSISGYFGVATRNLCKSISYDGKLDRTFYYEDYNEYGYPQTLRIVDSDDDVQVYALTWEKL